MQLGNTKEKITLKLSRGTGQSSAQKQMKTASVRVEWPKFHTALRIMSALPANLSVQTPLLKESQLPRTV